MHFKLNIYLKLKADSYKDIQDYNVKIRKTYTYPVFLPVKVEQDGLAFHTRVVTFDKKHVDYLDVIHTLAYLESNKVGRNMLTLERSYGRFGWKVVG